MGRLNRDSPLPAAARPRVEDPLVQRAFDTLATPLIEVIKFLTPYRQQEKWQNLAFQSGWRDYADTRFHVAEFRKNPLGRVELRGIVTRFSGVTTAIGVLPVGYRAAKGMLFPVVGNAGAGQLTIYSDGLIEYASGGTTFLSLEGITFDTES